MTEGKDKKKGNPGLDKNTIEAIERIDKNVALIVQRFEGNVEKFKNRGNKDKH